MTTQQIGLLMIQLVASLSVMAVIGVFLLQNHEARQKYKLYAVRDKLLYLAATGKLAQTSMVFKVFYRAMNAYAARVEDLSFFSFVKASIAARTELEKQNKERLFDSLRRSDPEVQAVINEFCGVVMESLLFNSPLLHVFLAATRHCGRIVSFVRRHGRFGVPVYDTYRFYEAMHGSLQPAH